jgi:hypothetical protein
MGDGYFYTLSAIAQSFAAIIALNAVFVIFKLQTLKNQRAELIKKLSNLRLEDMIKNGKWKEEAAVSDQNRWTEDFLLNWALDKGGMGDMADRKNRIHQNVQKGDRFRKGILQWLKRTLLLNGGIIILSLFLLPWGKFIPDDPKCVFVLCILALAAFALAVTVHAILFSVELGGLPIIEKIFLRKCGLGSNLYMLHAFITFASIPSPCQYLCRM